MSDAEGECVLELIDKGEVTQAHAVPLLFVHGAWHAAWCWGDHFLDFFADRGFRAVAVSLHGHGASTVPRRAARFRDYVGDIRSVAALLGSEPVLVGHSLGALVVQKYLEERRTPAAVLLAPHPPQQTRRAVVAMRASLRHPVRVIQSMTIGTFADMVNTPHLAREAFFLAALRKRLLSPVPSAWNRGADARRPVRCSSGLEPHGW
ncbi:MAG: hypothetical protein QOD58_597 [Mycobacterium sp.]|nr:hypothetical protein [Mycobacterium sp.]